MRAFAFTFVAALAACGDDARVKSLEKRVESLEKLQRMNSDFELESDRAWYCLVDPATPLYERNTCTRSPDACAVAALMEGSGCVRSAIAYCADNERCYLSRAQCAAITKLGWEECHPREIHSCNMEASRSDFPGAGDDPYCVRD